MRNGAPNKAYNSLVKFYSGFEVASASKRGYSFVIV